MNRDVARAIDSERRYQRRNRGEHGHTPGEWLLIMEKVLADAKRAWYETPTGASPKRTMQEIRQVVAVGVAAMEQHGAPERP